MKVILCWCCPPDMAYALYEENPCTYPDCPNGKLPDPRGYYESEREETV